MVATRKRQIVRVPVRIRVHPQPRHSAHAGIIRGAIRELSCHPIAPVVSRGDVRKTHRAPRQRVGYSIRLDLKRKPDRVRIFKRTIRHDKVVRRTQTRCEIVASATQRHPVSAGVRGEIHVVEMLVQNVDVIPGAVGGPLGEDSVVRRRVDGDVATCTAIHELKRNPVSVVNAIRHAPGVSVIPVDDQVFIRHIGRGSRQRAGIPVVIKTSRTAEVNCS